MRILCMHKDPRNEPENACPPKELVEGMGQLIGEAVEQGIMLAGDGLLPGAKRYRLAFANGRCEVTKGTQGGVEEQLPQRILIIKVAAEPDAIEWAKRFGEAVDAPRLELRERLRVAVGPGRSGTSAWIVQPLKWLEDLQPAALADRRAAARRPVRSVGRARDPHPTASPLRATTVERLHVVRRARRRMRPPGSRTTACFPVAFQGEGSVKWLAGGVGASR